LILLNTNLISLSYCLYFLKIYIYILNLDTYGTFDGLIVSMLFY